MWGDEGAGLAQAGPGGPPGSQAGGTPTTSTGKCLEGSLLGRSDSTLLPGEWTAGARVLGTGWVGEHVLVALSAWGRPWCGPGTRALRTAILGFEASRRQQAVCCSRAPPDRQRAPSKV